MIESFKPDIKNCKKVLIAVALLFIIFFPTIKWLAHPGFFRVDDDIQTMRVLEMTKCIQDGQIPCRWVPDMGYGYGYPQFIYYSPLPYYLMSLFHLAGLSIITSVKLYFALALVFSFFTFYYLARRFVTPLAALFGSFLYLYAPYRLTDVFNRGAVGEFSAWLIVPFILAFVFDLSQKPSSKKSWIYFVSSLSALILTHNLSLVLYFPLLVVWGLYWLVQTKDKKGYLIVLFKGGILALFLTGWFWLPMLYYQNQVHIETMFWGYFNYLAHFLSLKEILVTHFWDWGDSQLGIWDRMTLSLGIWASFLTIVTLFLAYLKKGVKQKHLLGVLFLTLLGMLFLTHSKSTFIYQSLPFLQKLQFPWRWLSPAVFLTSFIISFFLDLLKKKERNFIFLLFVFLIMLHYGSWFNFEKWQNYTDKTKFSGNSWRQQQTISIFDYLPKSAKHPPTQPSPEQPHFIKGKGQLISYHRRTNSWSVKLRVETLQSVVEVPNFYYPGWVVKEEGRHIPFYFDNELGLIQIPLSSGRHNLKIKMERTLVFWLADIASLIGLSWLFIYLLRS